MSVYEQWEFSLEEAMDNEFRHGLKSLTSGALDGARRFAVGAGRQGSFEKTE